MPEFEYRLRINAEQAEAQQVVDSLSGHDGISVRPVESVLNHELAQRLNADCGGSLPDETLISDFLSFSLKNKPRGQDLLGVWANIVAELTNSEKKHITATISAFHYKGYETVGQIRAASLEDMIGVRNISDARASFIQKVFEKPIDPELAMRSEHV